MIIFFSYIIVSITISLSYFFGFYRGILDCWRWKIFVIKWKIDNKKLSKEREDHWIIMLKEINSLSEEEERRVALMSASFLGFINLFFPPFLIILMILEYVDLIRMVKSLN